MLRSSVTGFLTSSRRPLADVSKPERLSLKRRAGTWSAIGSLLIAMASTQAQAQVGGGYWEAYTGQQFSDPYAACEHTAEEHMGTWLVKAVQKIISPTYIVYSCYYPHFLAAGGVHSYGQVDLECPSGTRAQPTGICAPPLPDTPQSCSAGDPDSQAPTVGNPTTISSGAKTEKFLDFSGPEGLELARYYSSRPAPRLTGLGVGWSLSFDRSLYLPNWQTRSEIYVYRPDGGQHLFDEVGVDSWEPRSGEGGKLELVPGSGGLAYTLRNADGRIDHFKINTDFSRGWGQLTKSEWRSGYTQSTALHGSGWTCGHPVGPSGSNRCSFWRSRNSSTVGPRRHARQYDGGIRQSGR